VRKTIAQSKGYFVIEHDDGTYRVEKGSEDIRVDVAAGLTFDEAIEYIRPKSNET
jgi:hypothetical protein